MDLDALYTAQLMDIHEEAKKELALFFVNMEDKDYAYQIAQGKKVRDFLHNLNEVD